MEIIIVLAFLGFIVYREWLYNEHIKDLELRLFTRNTKEYYESKFKEKTIIDPKIKEDKENIYLDPIDVDPEEALRALKEDN